MKIFDCFTFYNELDLLEIRLNELYNTVDHFVIVEADQTFTGRPKNYIFDQARSRYEKFMDKIIYVQVNDMPGGPDPWQNERHQRNAIVRGIVDAAPDDIIIISDCDEVPRARAVETMQHSGQQLFALRMPLFNFKFNYMRTTPGEYEYWAMASCKQILDANTPDVLRNTRFNPAGFYSIEHAGWHFGYLGDNDYLRDKAQSFSHQEVNSPEFLAAIDVEKSIAERKEWDRNQANQYKIVELNDYFPATLINYPKFILDNAEENPYNLLPPFTYK